MIMMIILIISMMIIIIIILMIIMIIIIAIARLPRASGEVLHRAEEAGLLCVLRKRGGCSWHRLSLGAAAKSARSVRGLGSTLPLWGQGRRM